MAKRKFQIEDRVRVVNPERNRNTKRYKDREGVIVDYWKGLYRPYGVAFGGIIRYFWPGELEKVNL